MSRAPRTARHGALAAAALVALLATAARAAGSTLRHEPPPFGVRGQAATITLELEGGRGPDALSGDAVCQLHYRAQGSSDFATVPLLPDGSSRYAADIPAAATGGLMVSYYLDVVLPETGPVVSFGSGRAPLTLTLRDPLPSAPPRRGVPLAATLALACAGLGGAVLVRWARRRAGRRVLEQVFWARTLFPLQGLEGAALAQALEALAGRELEVPGGPPRRFAKATLRRRLLRVRRVDLEALERALAVVQARADAVVAGGSQVG